MALLWVMLVWPVGSARAEEDYELNAPGGAPFFLLTDTSYSSHEQAQVRFEVKSEDLFQVDEADGAEVALYRVDRPLEFLQKQRNLHRIDLKAAARPEGLANTLSYLWDQWWRRVRQTWQGIFDGKLRQAVTQANPQLKTPTTLHQKPVYVHQGAYQALPGFTEVSRFRYPVGQAKPIAPPQDLKLDGSSSEFTSPREGNVYIPLGQQKPGLYVVEAAVGRHRAVALLFVTDTLAVTKTSARQLFVWTAQRNGGRPAAGAELVWSDLNGVLGRGQTDRDGVFVADHAVPETSYVFGQDQAGGVFITENFYYDSEIYNTKLYAYTDRPLYRPGDEVNIRLYGREFTSATRSTPMARGPVSLTVMDATGTPVHQATLDYQSDVGAATRFTLPANAPVGGYDIVMKRGDDDYTASFRVAPYVKPHFEVLIEPGQATFKTGQALKGRIRLRYPDGKPVRDGEITLSARAQTLTMVDGDLQYGGAFPVQIDDNQTLTTDSDGEAKFELPALKEPSKLILTVLATDGAAQRVRSTKDLLIERAATAWRLQADRQFAAPKEAVAWRYSLAEPGKPAAQRPAKWVAIHQESQTREQGELPARPSGAPAEQGGSLTLQLARPGSYTVEVHDADDRLLGAAPFWVSGGGLQPPQGAIDIVFDRTTYKAGDTARALITFPVAVADALLTLERDQVEQHGRLGEPGKLARLKRLSDRQWEASIVVQAEHAPNITLSVAYLNDHEFGFQNAGIVVAQPELQVAIQTDRTSYLPGDTVTVDIDTRNTGGQGVPAVLSLGVVDDMVYALQPELAPGVNQFFYHLRRNNVRTHSSLSFITYDEAVDPRQAESIARGQQERAVKVLERPRRDERDTAFFDPALRTDAQGHARVTFTMPDALTRWRLTAKGYGQGAADGLLGERRAYVQSDKPFFARWTGATWLREGDQTQATVTVFNQTGQASELELVAQAEGQTLLTQALKAEPGATQVALPLPALARSQDVTVLVRQRGRVVDQLLTRLTVAPLTWLSERALSLPLAAGATQTALSLPADARQVRVRVVGDGQAAWAQVADGLIDYPYGCVEQTASRMVPLALAIQGLGATSPEHPLRQRLYAARLRLVAMSGPDAVFGWWGRGTSDSAFLSAYAYHADRLATEALGLKLPDEHWARLLDIYSKQHGQDTLPQRAWSLWFMQGLGLPTGNMVEGLIETLAQEQVLGAPAAAPAASAAAAPQPTSAAPPATSPLSPAAMRRLTSPGPFAVTGPAQQALTLVLARELARHDNKPWPAALAAPLEAASVRLESEPSVLAQALLVATGRRPAQGEAMTQALQQATEAEPTLDRALALSLLARQLTPRAPAVTQALSPAGAWQRVSSPSGQTEWRWPAALGGVSTPAATPAYPATIDWQAPVPAAARLLVRYQSATAQPGDSSRLPATVQRKLYALALKDGRYHATPVAAGAPLQTGVLYLDELTLQASQTVRRALVELALPPGGSLEPSTWGVTLDEGKEGTALEAATGEARPTGYAVPVELLEPGHPMVVRHLIRLGQKGRHQLPAARMWRMYMPDSQTSEAGPARQTWTVQ
jgi:uncharacterized protein YfaS (alpha-2-macroglobulin family)